MELQRLQAAISALMDDLMEINDTFDLIPEITVSQYNERRAAISDLTKAIFDELRTKLPRTRQSQKVRSHPPTLVHLENPEVKEETPLTIDIDVKLDDGTVLWKAGNCLPPYPQDTHSTTTEIANIRIHK